MSIVQNKDIKGIASENLTEIWEFWQPEMHFNGLFGLKFLCFISHLILD